MVLATLCLQLFQILYSLTHSLTHTHIHAHIHTHTHIHKQKFSLSLSHTHTHTHTHTPFVWGLGDTSKHHHCSPPENKTKKLECQHSLAPSVENMFVERFDRF